MGFRVSPSATRRRLAAEAEQRAIVAATRHMTPEGMRAAITSAIKLSAAGDKLTDWEIESAVAHLMCNVFLYAVQCGAEVSRDGYTLKATGARTVPRVM